ncbi:MAG TPA: hypothetical protein VNH83_28360 [Bryobacteraceae bacterium]|nr:hypothetical protein [Bryobacteraceae bacterium]
MSTLPKVSTIQQLGLLVSEQLCYPRGVTLENGRGPAIEPIDGVTFRLHFVIRFEVAQKAMGATLTLCPMEHNPKRLQRIIIERLKELSEITYEDAKSIIEQAERMSKRMDKAAEATEEYARLRNGEGKALSA